MTQPPEPVDLKVKRDWKPRTMESLRDALQRFCDAAWNRGQSPHIFTIPVDDDRDADCILSDGISELEHLRGLVRAQRAALEAIEWAGRDTDKGEAFCPQCGHSSKHANDCSLAAVLTLSRDEKGGQ